MLDLQEDAGTDLDIYAFTETWLHGNPPRLPGFEHAFGTPRPDGRGGVALYLADGWQCGGTGQWMECCGSGSAGCQACLRICSWPCATCRQTSPLLLPMPGSIPLLRNVRRPWRLVWSLLLGTSTCAGRGALRAPTTLPNLGSRLTRLSTPMAERCCISAAPLGCACAMGAWRDTALHGPPARDGAGKPMLWWIITWPVRTCALLCARSERPWARHLAVTTTRCA